MPLWKWISNRGLTLIQNICFGYKLSEYHTGFRCFSRKVLEQIPWYYNSNGFVFDNEFLAQALYAKFRIGEISCPARYQADSSSTSFKASLEYGLGCLKVTGLFLMNKWGWRDDSMFHPSHFGEMEPKHV